MDEFTKIVIATERIFKKFKVESKLGDVIQIRRGNCPIDTFTNGVFGIQRWNRDMSKVQIPNEGKLSIHKWVNGGYVKVR